ncbi:MAG: DNA mismatch repair protein MutS [Gemmatimonadota bacterium]
MTKTAVQTPLIQQYLDVKSRHRDALLLFRVGDFYEMFFEDAEEGSKLLGIVLTARNNGPTQVPLAGIPVKALDEYLPRLVQQGRRVAICEQVEDAAQAEGLVRREVTEIVTPGTALQDSLLTAGRNNFLAAIAFGDRSAAGGRTAVIAAADLSTGELEVRMCPERSLADELARLEPAEIVVPADEDVPSGGWVETRREAWRFDPEFGAETLRRHYGVHGTGGFGIHLTEDPELAAAAGAVVAYLEEVRPAGVTHLQVPRVDRSGEHVHIDGMTRRNLELVEPIRAGDGGTLLSVLDRALTPMGKRLLRRRILRPLTDAVELEARLDAVADLHQRRDTRKQLRAALREIRDLERLATKLAAGRITPRELLALARSLAPLPELEASLASPRAARLGDLVEGFAALDPVRERIDSAIDAEAPAALGAGGVMREAYSEELDALRAERDQAVDWIAQLQPRERERTGIERLKIGYNKVFGYYIEVSRANSDRVPEDYTRKQTLANAERYVTPELKEWEARVVTAEDGIMILEARLYAELRESLADHVSAIQGVAARVAKLDVHACLADVADRQGYVRPVITSDFILDIQGGRHPVVEEQIAREDFIPNDVRLDDDMFCMILTGPNMAGKSTVLRQVGLIALMAQIGSFVPASAARVGLCDRIFTRVGASDSLASGQSTFMVEMTETATILNSATDRSLVLLDEIGRGTSTYDGVAIAWSVTEHLHESICARTIFATHYHEMVELADVLRGVGAFNVAVRESGGDIVFLRRLEPGGSDRSYGVHVARLAGLPGAVIERARAILRRLEERPASEGMPTVQGDAESQLGLFAVRRSRVMERLGETDPDAVTPLESLNILSELKRLAETDEI